MLTPEWTQLVQQVDRLIQELGHSRAEAQRWRRRATELESLHLGDDRSTRLEEQAKERELERLRKDKTKAIAVIEKMVAELEQMQAQVLETEEGN
jgi:DNA repair ATPase RecN